VNAPLRKVLWVDCTAALLAGSVVLSLSARLADLYAMPRELVVGMGVANVCYGTFSLSLAARSHPPSSLVVLLVAANATWAALCAVAAFVLWGTASSLGLAHLVGEGLFVGGLARWEWTRSRTGSRRLVSLDVLLVLLGLLAVADSRAGTLDDPSWRRLSGRPTEADLGCAGYDHENQWEVALRDGVPVVTIYDPPGSEDPLLFPIPKDPDRAGDRHVLKVDGGLWFTADGSERRRLRPPADAPAGPEDPFRAENVEVRGFVFTSEDLGAHWTRLDEFEGEGYARVLTSVTLEDGSIVRAHVYELSESRAGMDAR
jgi:hypothetical protein